MTARKRRKPSTRRKQPDQPPRVALVVMLPAMLAERIIHESAHHGVAVSRYLSELLQDYFSYYSR